MSKKIYMVVTNDQYELPVSGELVGAKSVADFIGLTVGTIRTNLSRDKWRGKYKAVIVGEVEFNQKEYMKQYNITHDRSEYFQDRWRNKHGFKKTV